MKTPLTPVSHSRAMLEHDICGVTICLTGAMRKAFMALHEMGCPVLVRQGEKNKDVFYISAEAATEEIWASYYDFDYPYINPRIESELANHGLECDWENPGCLVVYYR